MLSDTSRFTGSDLGFANRIEKGGLAVIDMAHHRNHRSAWDQVLLAVFFFMFTEDFFLKADDFDFRTKIPGDLGSGLAVQSLIDGGEYTLSRRRFSTSLARTSSFSESSLMLTPSVMVMVRLIWISSGAAAAGGGAAWRSTFGTTIFLRPGGTAVPTAPAAGRAVGCMGRGSPGRRKVCVRVGMAFGRPAAG